MHCTLSSPFPSCATRNHELSRKDTCQRSESLHREIERHSERNTEKPHPKFLHANIQHEQQEALLTTVGYSPQEAGTKDKATPALSSHSSRCRYVTTSSLDGDRSMSAKHVHSHTLSLYGSPCMRRLQRSGQCRLMPWRYSTHGH